LQMTRGRMVAELKDLASQLGRRPTLIEYLAETHYDLAGVYKPSIGGWYALLDEGRFLAEPLAEADILLSRRFQLMLHVDSIRRLRFYLDHLKEDQLPVKSIPPVDRRMVEMLTYYSARLGSRIAIGQLGWLGCGNVHWPNLNLRNYAAPCWIG
jgi:hypothetical protein